MYILCMNYRSGALGCDLAESTGDITDWIKEFLEGNDGQEAVEKPEEWGGEGWLRFNEVIGKLLTGELKQASLEVSSENYLYIFHHSEVGRWDELIERRRK